MRKVSSKNRISRFTRLPSRFHIRFFLIFFFAILKFSDWEKKVSFARKVRVSNYQTTNLKTDIIPNPCARFSFASISKRSSRHVGVIPVIRSQSRVAIYYADPQESWGLPAVPPIKRNAGDRRDREKGHHSPRLSDHRQRARGRDVSPRGFERRTIRKYRINHANGLFPGRETSRSSRGLIPSHPPPNDSPLRELSFMGGKF